MPGNWLISAFHMIELRASEWVNWVNIWALFMFSAK